MEPEKRFLISQILSWIVLINFFLSFLLSYALIDEDVCKLVKNSFASTLPPVAWIYDQK